MNPWKRREVIGDCTLYLGDCLEILPTLPKVDVVIADPVYPILDYGWGYVPIEQFNLDCRQFYFWMNLAPFPLTPTALHVWSKSNIYIGDSEQFELIYEVKGKKLGSCMREGAINSKMAAQMNSDQFYDHPCQKPLKLMNRLVRKTEGMVLDPFMGSGTTGVACANLGRKFIGIEIEEKYFNIAVERITNAYRQQKLFGDAPLDSQPTAIKPQQQELT